MSSRRRRAIGATGAILLALVGIGVIDKALAATILFGLALLFLAYAVFEPPISRWAGRYPILVRMGLGDDMARRQAIRDRLADLILEGDQAWNAASIAYQIWKAEQGPLVSYGLPAKQPASLSTVPEWWKEVDRWLAAVEDYLAETPELGQASARLFRAQEPLLGEIPLGKTPLSVENRTQTDMKLVRLKQDRLREIVEKFEG